MANVNDIVKTYSMIEFSNVLVCAVDSDTLEAYTVYKSNYKDRLDWYFGHASIKIPAEVLRREVKEFNVISLNGLEETPTLFIDTYEYTSDYIYKTEEEAE